jgi:predicted nucleic acid-binding protein
VNSPPLIYVIDTIALVKYFEDDLPARANSIFKSAEEGKAKLLVPSIVIGEFMYIALKGRLKAQDPLAAITELISDMESSSYLVSVDMGTADWKIFLELKVPELHDRMICAMSLRHSAKSIITNDLEIQKEGRTTTVW